MKGIYVHIPFCRVICTYCDFIKEVAKPKRHRRYVEALCREIAMAADRLNGATTLYLGGGTPSLLDDDDLRLIFDAIAEVILPASLQEVTIEANPEDITEAKAALFKRLGINRVSLGVQTFHPDALRFLRRTHEPADVFQAVLRLQTAGIMNINLDLIFALPNQTMAELRHDLDEIVRLDPTHVSAYSLIVEEGTRLKTLIDQGEVTPADEDTEADMFNAVIDTLTTHGYTHYEISNFAKPSCESAHNRMYWENREYVGLGVGAHGHEGNRRLLNTPRVKDYLERLENHTSPVVADDPDEGIKDTLIMGLRLREGVSLKTMHTRHGVDVFTHYPALEKARDNGLIEVVKGNLRLTHKGMLLGNEVFMIF